MEPFEAKTHVFIVRIWLERRHNATAAPEWRGVIEHVPTGERKYVTDLGAIAVFVVPYLTQLGVQVKRRRRYGFRHKS